jgi:putative hydrolase of the HAD superfamily
VVGPTPEIWWDHVETILAGAYRGVGLEEDLARELSQVAHLRYVDPESFELFADTIPVLNELREKGWSHIILSNHVPQLPAIVGI